jgi:hypothetical protein
MSPIGVEEGETRNLIVSDYFGLSLGPVFLVSFNEDDISPLLLRLSYIISFRYHRATTPHTTKNNVYRVHIW